MTSEAEKLSSHLSLLRTEYVKLQQKCAGLERELAVLSAQSGRTDSDSFVCRLLATVSGLHNQPLYSDLTILTPASQLSAHKFVLSCRSSDWGVSSLAEVQTLDWSDLEEGVSTALLSWVYTDSVSLVSGDQGDRFTLQLMAAASKFKLKHLMDRCEQALVSSVSVSNCIRFYATAHEIKATKLAEHCSQLISSNWDQFNYQDFQFLSAELVYGMLKSKASFPLHSAISLRREDVVFLYLIEFNSELNVKLNQLDDAGRLPLDLALESEENGIAKSLVEHQANINQMNTLGESILHLAIARADVKSAMFLLTAGAQVNLPTVNDRSGPLHLLAASKADLTSVAEAVIEKGADLNLQNIDGETAISVAVQGGNRSVFDLLLSKGANLELPTTSGKTVLWFALQDEEGKLEDDSFASKLISRGADPSSICSPSGDTILHSLAHDGKEEAGLYLVSEGAKVDNTNRRGETVLHLACQKGLATLATALMVAGADPNIQTNSSAGDTWRQTALHLALASGQEAVVTCMLEFSQPSEGLSTTLLDLNLKNSADETPLAVALGGGFNHLAQQMIQSGADVNVTDGSGLSLLLKAIQDKNLGAATFLLANGADINTRSPQGMTPLELAVREGVEQVVDKLCQAGADTTSSSNGEPPLWIALEAENYTIGSILVRHGVDTDCWGEGPDGCQQTLLHRAVDENKEEVGSFLIRSGCDLNCSRREGVDGKGGDEARDGQAPLHLATQWGQEGVVTTLIEHGANINLADSEGKTVLHHAIESGQHGIINLLLGCPGIDLQSRDKSGLSPFAAAMTYKNNSAARVILELEPGAAEQPDSRGKNFLHTAIIKGDLESLLFLISINVNVHSKTTDSNKLAPILLAVQVGNEMMVRNLLLAGASTAERTLTGQTGLHLAAEADSAEIAGVLLANSIDFAAVDERGNNALHVAVKEGNLKTARILLTESRIDAEVFNSKGRSPLHVLARFGDDKACDMLDLFLECMPDYNIDRPDTEGNTPLLLAYIKGSGDLCRAFVKRGAILGTLNKSGVNIFNHQVATKQLLFRLLDLLSQEPRWGEGDCCEECQTKFGLTTRRHHCRHCGRLLCSKCSAKEMPIIKYNLSKQVRVCDVCSDLLTLGVGAGGNPF